MFAVWAFNAIGKTCLSCNNNLRIILHTRYQFIFRIDTASKLYNLTVYLSVSVNIYVTFARTSLLNNGHIGNNHSVFVSEIQCHTSEHSGTHTLVGICQGNLYRECMRVGINAGINKAYVTGKLLIAKGIKTHHRLGTFLYLCEIRFGYIYQKFYRSNLFYGKNRLCRTVHVAIIIITGSYHSADRTKQLCILQKIVICGLQYVEIGLRGIPF